MGREVTMTEDRLWDAMIANRRKAEAAAKPGDMLWIDKDGNLQKKSSGPNCIPDTARSSGADVEQIVRPDCTREYKPPAIAPNENFITKIGGKIYIPLCRDEDGEQIYIGGHDGNYWRISEDMVPFRVNKAGGHQRKYVLPVCRDICQWQQEGTLHITDDPPRFPWMRQFLKGLAASALAGLVCGGAVAGLWWVLTR